MYSQYAQWLQKVHLLLLVNLARLYTVILPLAFGDLAMVIGDYEEAISHYEKTTRFLLCRAEASDSEGYQNCTSIHLPPYENRPRLYFKGHLPYSTPVPKDSYELLYEDYAGMQFYYRVNSFCQKLVTEKLHLMERRYLKLKHGNALLEWADALYRKDTPPSIARAREIYKAVFGSSLAVSPSWPSQGRIMKKLLPSPLYCHFRLNPAVRSQIARAQKGVMQISSGLNFFGANDSLIPSLRYRSLKDAADSLAAAAKAAQNDFLVCMEKIEEALREHIVIANMIKKAGLMAQVADEQVEIAKFGVMLAERQVAQVKQAIEAKKQEIEDHEGLFSQLSDFFGGMVDFPKDLTDYLRNNVTSGLGMSIGTSAAEGGLATAAAPLAGYGAIVYAGASSLYCMGEEQNGRRAELRALQNSALPMAQAAKRTKEREVTIANLHRAIAEADADLGAALLKFQETRFLNPEFWKDFADVMVRVMMRYLELGARYAWLAERALAFEQNRSIMRIRFGITYGDR